MAIVKIPQLGRTLIMPAEIQLHLAAIGVRYERWSRVPAFAPNAAAEEILSVYAPEIEAYQTRQPATCDLVELLPDTPDLEEMLGKFGQEHWHNEEETHFVVCGRGVVFIHPAGQPVTAMELEPGDLVSVGPGIRHWFELCKERRMRVLRFTPTAGYHTGFSGTGIEEDFEPVCLGPAYFAFKGQHVA